ncbi:MAG: GH92 family glycosyl hydrolase [Polyangiales bacterium]
MRRLGFVLLGASSIACSKQASDAQPAVDDSGIVDANADASSDDDVALSTKPPSTPVDPVFVGTGGFAYAFGSAFAGAAAPNGLVKVGPDTKGPWGTISFLHYDGYWYGDDTILGFSQLHLSGTGAADYGVLGVMPTVEAITSANVTETGYASTFAKASEHGAPGYYAVTLDRGSIGVELTATPHAALHRYAFPSGTTTGRVIFDLDHHLQSGTISSASVSIDATGRISGTLHSVGQMSGGFGGYDVFYEIRASKPPTASAVWSQGMAPTPGMTATGTQVGFALDFDVADGAPIVVEVGLSLVSNDGAKSNLDAELPALDFDGAWATTTAAWQAVTGVVRFAGATTALDTMLKAALYHAFLMPTYLGDADGQYRFGAVTVPKGSFAFLSDMSLWDTYRTVHPLYATIAPARARDAVLSLAAMAAARASVFPRWPIATGEAGTMIGASAEILVSDAVARGAITQAEAEPIWQQIRTSALDGTTAGRDHFAAYTHYGYVPASVGGSVSWTLESAQDDFASGQLATALGHPGDGATLLTRAHSWQHLFDPTTQLLWAKHEDGSWATGHVDATDLAGDFVEANANQSVWGAPHDPDGYATIFGSRANAVQALESFFEQSQTDWDATDWTNQLTANAPRPFYWGGNEPSLHIAYLFAQLGRPDLTQRWARWAAENLYSDGADGLPGNDDGGTMSCWLVYTALGFYPLVGTDRYVVGAPLVPHAELDVAGGTFTIDAQGSSDATPYVQSVTLNGSPLTVAELHQSDLKAGGSLTFVMGAAPSTWGAAP